MDHDSSSSALYLPAQIDSHELWLGCPWEIGPLLVDLAVMAGSCQTNNGH